MLDAQRLWWTKRRHFTRKLYIVRKGKHVIFESAAVGDTKFGLLVTIINTPRTTIVCLIEYVCYSWLRKSPDGSLALNSYTLEGYRILQ